MSVVADGDMDMAVSREMHHDDRRGSGRRAVDMEQRQ
jgi:hypothetical protein